LWLKINCIKCKILIWASLGEVLKLEYFYPLQTGFDSCPASDGSGSKIFDPCRVASNFFSGSGRVGSGQFFVARVWLGWVSHLWFEFGFGKFPLKMSNFNFFPFGLARKVPGSKAGRPLIYCRSKVSSGRVRLTHRPS